MTALYVIGAIILILVIMGFVFSGEMRVERTIAVARPVANVFDFLKFTGNHDKFSEWNMADPAMKKEYRGTDGQIGFVYRWDSQNKNVGAGEQETTGLKPNESLDYELRFQRPMKSVAKGHFILKSTGGNSCDVTWIFAGDSTFPMSIMKPLMTRMLGSSMQRSLNNLKKVLEA